MKAIILPQYQGNIIRALRSLEYTEQQPSTPSSSEVVVSIDASPCNPSDLAFIQGGYNVRKSLPAIPGFEGTGTIVDAGSSADARALLGRRVSFFTQSDTGGAWATQSVLQPSDCIPISDDLPVGQAACFAVNPFTAYAMAALAAEHSCRAIIQNAASGQVARFLNVMAEQKGISVINIVRKAEQVGQLQTEGVSHVLFAGDEHFRESLADLSATLGATLAFDAVGGEQSGHLVGAMPEGSGLYLYGALGSRTLSEIPATEVIFKKKFIRGFNMNEWKAALDRRSFDAISAGLQQAFLDGSLHTRIQGSWPLEKHAEALMQYIRNMSDGKIILTP